MANIIKHKRVLQQKHDCNVFDITKEIHKILKDNTLSYALQTFQNKIDLLDLVLTADFDIYVDSEMEAVFLYCNLQDEFICENGNGSQNLILFWNGLVSQFAEITTS